MSASQKAAKEKQMTKKRDHLLTKGVRWKQFEHALIKLLPHVTPSYISLPASTEKQLFDWDELPPAARVHGTLPGQLPSLQRAIRKENQIQSILQCVFALLPKDKSILWKEECKIVDFGGGSGHLSIPLALLLPNCTVVVVDLKQKSLDLLHEKANHCNPNGKKYNKFVLDHSKLQSTAISNLYTFFGDINSYQLPFHIGVALHVCGEATDLAIRKCAKHNAHMVVAPCCVGKLNRQKHDPYIYRATSQNIPTVQYPQSQLFQQCLQCSPSDNDTTNTASKQSTLSNEWDALAKAADYCHELDMHNPRNASRRTAKGVLEMDRLFFLQESYPAYVVALTRMVPLSASPKHDILIAYHKNNVPTQNQFAVHINIASRQEDPVVTWTREYLLHPGSSGACACPSHFNGVNDKGKSTAIEKKEDSKDLLLPKKDGVNWTWQEEEEIRSQLKLRFPALPSSTAKEGENMKKLMTSDNSSQPIPPPNNDHNETYIFPTGMGGRKRKLIHHVADQLGLAHWGLGKKHAEKTVAVRRRYGENNVDDKV